MKIREYILESFGGVRFIWKLKLKLERRAIARMEGDNFETSLSRISAITKPEFNKVIPELAGEDLWFVYFKSTSGFTFGVDDKSRKAIQMLINQLKDVTRETQPDGYIFKVNVLDEWDLMRLYQWILVPTMKKVLGYNLYEKKQIAQTLYFVFRRK